MKKLLSLITMMLILLVILTGCVNINQEVTINKNGTADIACIYGFDKSSLQQLGTSAENIIDGIKQKAEENEYEIEAYSDDEVEGFRAKKHVNNLSDISLGEIVGEEYVPNTEENQFKLQKKGLKSEYSQNAKIDLSYMDETTASMITIKYVINLPTKAGDNNANEVSNNGKTLTWNLVAGKINEVNFTATAFNSTAIIIMCVLVALIVLVVVIIILKKVKKGKNKVSGDDTEKIDTNK